MQQDQQTYPFYAAAIANYTAQPNLPQKQHSFQKGEIFQITRLASPGWYEGHFAGKLSQEVALVPGNYIEPTSWESAPRSEKNFDVPKHSVLKPLVPLNQRPLSKRDQPSSQQVLSKAPP